MDSPSHTEDLVVKVVTTVVSSVDEQQAKNCFHTSKQLGQAVIVSCLKEHAEFFTQMLNRSELPFMSLAKTNCIRKLLC